MVAISNFKAHKVSAIMAVLWLIAVKVPLVVICKANEWSLVRDCIWNLLICQFLPFSRFSGQWMVPSYILVLEQPWSWSSWSRLLFGCRQDLLVGVQRILQYLDVILGCSHVAGPFTCSLKNSHLGHLNHQADCPSMVSLVSHNIDWQHYLPSSSSSQQLFHRSMPNKD